MSDFLSTSNKPEDFDSTQLKKGVDVEKEHVDGNNKLTDDEKIEISRKIAMDHLLESPKYYEELAKMEKKIKESGSVKVIKAAGQNLRTRSSILKTIFSLEKFAVSQKPIKAAQGAFPRKMIEETSITSGGNPTGISIRRLDNGLYGIFMNRELYRGFIPSKDFQWAVQAATVLYNEGTIPPSGPVDMKTVN